jgi:hypothetical protein
MLKKIIGVVGVLACIVLFLFINGTKPATVGPLGILVVFLCLYLILFTGLTFFIWGSYKLIVKVLSPLTIRRPMEPLSFQRSYYFSSILALGPVMLIGMQSVGKIGIYEVGLVLLFMVIGCVYIAKRTA